MDLIVLKFQLTGKKKKFPFDKKPFCISKKIVFTHIGCKKKIFIAIHKL